MIKKAVILILLPCLIYILGSRCSTPKQVYSNKENLYKKNNQQLNAEFLAYHINDSVSQLYFSIPNENLIYKRPDTTSNFYAYCKIKYFIFLNGNSKQLLDSGSAVIFDKQSENVIAKKINGKLYMKMALGKLYTTEIHVYDINKKSKSTYLLSVDKTDLNTRQNFLVQKPNGKVLFSYYLQENDTIIVKSFLNTQSTYTIDYFYRDFPLAPPPFSPVERSSFNYKPDSSFNLSKSIGLIKLKMPKKGFYHIVTDANAKTGLTLFTVEETFPGIKDEREMIKSTRYIMSKKEYDACMNSANKKQAIDDFWLDIGGSNERAKELLKKYYNRVTEANKLFTSHQAGWQTDRGMIFIIFGAPTNMYKFHDGETWVYGNDVQPTTTTRFNFKKIANPFTDNDFLLERSENYKEPWYRAVDFWRQGRIYLDN